MIQTMILVKVSGSARELWFFPGAIFHLRPDILDNKVRFSSTAEVRSLPDSQSESIARMSHINAQRARQGRRIYRSAQKLTHVAKVGHSGNIFTCNKIFNSDCIYFCTSIFSWSIYISTFALSNSGTSGQYCLLNFRFIYTHSKFNISNTTSR